MGDNRGSQRAPRRKAGSRPPARSQAPAAPEGGRRNSWTRVLRNASVATTDRLSAPIAGATTAAWAAVLSFLTVGAVLVFTWILGAGSGEITDIVSFAGVLWLACHLVPINVTDGVISALPLGLIVVPAWHLWRAGRWATRRSGACQWREVRAMVGMGAAVYATIALLISTMTSTESVSISPLFAVIGTAAFVFVFFGAGASRQAQLWPSLTMRVSPQFRARLRGAAVGLLTVLAFAAAGLGISLALHFSTSLTLMDVLAPGVIGNVLLFVLSVLYLPNILVWAMSFVFGAGFAIGEGTVVSPFGVELAGMPAFPLLAAVPESYSQIFLLVLIVPLIAGALAMRSASGKSIVGLTGITSLIERAWVAGIAAIMMFALAWLAMGSLGIKNMSVLGTNPIFLAFNAFVLLFIGGWLGDAIRSLGARRRTVADVRVTKSTTDADVRERSRRRRLRQQT